MTCSEFHERFSEYHDGTAEPSWFGEADGHLASCAACRRYREVVIRGLEILRAAPEVTVGEDFLPRLQHRIYHIEDARAFTGSEAEAGSVAALSTALIVAAVIAFAAWSPALVRAPRVELSPIVVSVPEPRTVGVRPPELWVSTAGARVRTAVDRGLWDDPQLFLRYSPLLAPSVRRVASVRRADLE